MAAVGAALFFCVNALSSAPQVDAQGSQPQVTIRAPEGQQKHDLKEIVVPVEVSGVKNLAGFLFVMAYDRKVVRVKDVRQGPFVGSTGRDVSCDAPVIDEPNGIVRYFCVTLRTTPAGPDGGGVLAEVVFEPRDGGTTDLTLTKVELSDNSIPPQSITATASNGTLDVEKKSSFPLLLTILIGIAAGVVLLVLFEVVRRWRKSRSGSMMEGGAA